ncbi:MAG: pyridoxal kinase PdxY [Hyphomicrobiales bacterium]|nr:pyridoxal kinase PdxY [Hyphomicrobiales bacterium]
MSANRTVDRAVETPNAVIVVSSHVARGSVGNRAAVFALETLGHPVWAVPTVVLPWHTGHGPATRIVPSAEQFSAFMADLERSPWLGEVTAVLSGYLGNALQAADVAALVRQVKAHKPDALYVCDPVMGDKEGLYVPEATAEAMRDLLLPIADVATPNRYELEWIVGRKLNGTSEIVRAARELGPARMLVTSAPGKAGGYIGNLLVTAKAALFAEHRLISGPPSGMGDLTSSVFLARLLAGLPDEKALLTTTATVYEVLANAAARGGDELQLETDARSLSHPTAAVEMHRLAFAGEDAGK